MHIQIPRQNFFFIFLFFSQIWAVRQVHIPDQVQEQQADVVDGVHDVGAAQVERLLRELQLLQRLPVLALRRDCSP